MFDRIRKSLSFSSVVAVLALGLALGGTSYATVMITGAQIKDGTVTGADIKNGSVTGGDLKNAQVTGADVKDGSLTADDLAPSTLQAGPKGDKGDKGDRGDKGDKGDKGDAGTPGLAATAFSKATGGTGGFTVVDTTDFQLGLTCTDYDNDNRLEVQPTITRHTGMTVDWTTSSANLDGSASATETGGTYLDPASATNYATLTSTQLERRVVGTVVVNADGHITSVTYSATPAATQCLMQGTIVRGS